MTVEIADDGAGWTAAPRRLRSAGLGRERQRRGIRLAEAAALIGFCVSLLACALAVSSKKPIWADETISLRILTAPDWGRMWNAVTDLIGHMPAWFILARLWEQLFGSSVLAFRLLSTLCFAAGFVLVWTAARRVLDWRAVALGAGCILAFSPTLLVQNAEIRFYGLFFALTALSFHVFTRMARARPSSIPLVAGNAAVQAALVLTHVYGLLFSGLALAAAIGLDISRRRAQPRVYASYLAGMSAFLLWLGPFARQLDDIRDYDYLPAPKLYDLAHMAGVETNHLYLSIVVVLAVYAAAVLIGGAHHPAEPSSPAQTPATGRPDALPELAFAIALCFAPLGVWAVSRIVVPTMLPRYVLPSEIGYLILLAVLADRLLAAPRERAGRDGRRRIDTMLHAAVALLLFSPPLLAYHQKQNAGYADDDARFFELGLPIVVENGVAYLSRLGTNPPPGRYAYILDWDVATDPRNALGAAVDHKIIANMKHHFDDLDVETYDDFFARHPCFLVADAPATLWLDLRVMGNDRYRITRLGPLEHSPIKESMVLVESEACTRAPHSRPRAP